MTPTTSSAETPAELTLYFYPSPGLDWNSPAGLTRTSGVNKLLNRPRSLGHVSVRVKCEGIDILTGMTQENKLEGRQEVLFKGYGLGILLHNFKGELEKKEELEPELALRSKSGELSYLRFRTNRAICERLAKFLDEYKAKGGNRVYGMVPRPLYGEGGGCSAFGAAFVETAGFMLPEFEKSWTRSFLIPKSYIGGPSTGKYVSPIHMMFASRWANENEPHEKGFFWDPDLMHAWAVQTWEKEKAQPSGRYQTELWGKAKGLVVDQQAARVPASELIRSK